MQMKAKNVQIVLNGKFTPFSVDPQSILETSAIFNEFHLFPKELTEQRFQFTDDSQQISLIKSLELVSVNQSTVLQVRPEMLVFESNISTNTSMNELFKTFNKILTKIEKKINFSKVSRLGLVQTTQESLEDIELYKKENQLPPDIIENRRRVAFRKTIESISELVNYVETVEYVSKDAGAPQNLLTYSYDVNTLSEKDAPRFGVEEIDKFLNDSLKILAKD